MPERFAENRIRVGLAGYGMAGRVFHAPLLRSVPQLALTAIATSRAGEVAALDPAIRCLPHPENIFADPEIDLVVIATPSGTHAALTTEALRAGKHVVVDKPFALSLAEARELAVLSRQVGRHLFAFHNRRWDSDFLSIRAAIEEGIIGRVIQFESHFDRFRPQVRERWRENGGPGSGVWFDLGPHLVDQALLLFGQPQAVSADIAALREGSRADDFAHVALRYPGLRVMLQASLNAPNSINGGHPRFAVHGTRGSLVKHALDPQEEQLIAGLCPGDAAWGMDPDPLRIHDGAGGVTMRPTLPGCQQRFYEMVTETLLTGPDEIAVSPIRIEEILAVQEVIEAARISAREERVVTLPLP